jgi:hypothetical protein
MMIATAVPTRRREVLAIDMGTVLRPIWVSVNPSEEIYGKYHSISLNLSTETLSISEGI